MMITYVLEAMRALRMWDSTRIFITLISSAIIAAIIGVSTVLIPNSFFARDIPPEWWDYPLWILMSVLLGLLITTYIRRPNPGEPSVNVDSTHEEVAATEARSERRGRSFGSIGGILGWFAVGCPVCNKLALMVLGYTGALTYFAPLQPILAGLSVVLLLVAVIVRLKGQYSCPLPSQERELTR